MGQILKDEREKVANQVKERIAVALFYEGFISEEQMIEFQSKYAVVFRTKGWFGKMLGKLMGEPNDDDSLMDIMRVCACPDEEPKQPNFKLLKFSKEEGAEDKEKE